MQRLFLIIVLLTWAVAPAFTQTGDKRTDESANSEQTLLKLTRDWLDAEERHDRATLQRIIADDFQGTAPMGNTVFKEDVIPQEGTQAGGLSVNVQELKARLFGVTAVVTGRGTKVRGKTRTKIHYYFRKAPGPMADGCRPSISRAQRIVFLSCGQYTADQLLHMRMLCVNNEEGGDNIRQIQVDELYRIYRADKVTLFANYDLLYNKRYRAGAAVFERYLEIKKVDVSTELNLASCYTGMNRYDDAEALLNKVLARPDGDDNAPSEYGLSVLSNIRGRIDLGRGRYDKAQERFRAALQRYPNDSYYTLAFLYCAALREAKEGKPGEFEGAYKEVSARSRATENSMGYHIDALRAFTMVKSNRRHEASSLVSKVAKFARRQTLHPGILEPLPGRLDHHRQLEQPTFC